MADVKAGQKVRLWDGTNEFGFTNSNAVFVQPTDGTNDLDYVVVNSAYGATPTAMPIAGKYEAAPTTYGDGDATPLLVDENGRLQVDIISGGGSGTEYNEDAATPATITGGALMFERDDALATLTPAEGDWAAMRCNARGAAWVAIDDTDSVSIDDAGGSITVDGTVAATQSGTWTVDLGATDNAVLDQIELNTDFGTVVGGGTEATALRVTLANDSTGVLSIDDNGGSITVDGAVTVSATDLDIRDLTSVTDSVSVLQSTHDNLNANANLQVGDTDVSASNPVPVSKDGSANSETNPIYVHNVDTVVSGEEVHDYDTASAIAADATSNHDYTVAGTTFFVKAIHVSASSAGKWELQTGPVAGLTTKAVYFTTEANPSLTVEFSPPIEVPVTSTGTVRLIRTNRDNQAQDLYSTIIGNDV